MASETPEEIYVRDLLAARCGVTMRKLVESDTPTADYEVLHDGERAAVLEVKHLELTPRTPENGWHKSRTPELGGWMTKDVDNAPSRVATRIHDACKQLCAYAEPKILVFVNDEMLMDALDFDEAFNGYLDYGTEVTGYMRNVVSSEKHAIRRIAEEKWTIDLYVWINRFNGRRLWSPAGPLRLEKELGPFYWFASDVGYQIGRDVFGLPEVPRPIT